jgi:hypothetical protein
MLQFIDLLSQSNLAVGIWHQSCTDVVQSALPFKIFDRPITLIDTPGFDDTLKSDSEVLKIIAAFLEIS